MILAGVCAGAVIWPALFGSRSRRGIVLLASIGALVAQLVIEGFRWALLGTATRPGPMILVSGITALALLIGGAFFFRRMERTFADVV